MAMIAGGAATARRATTIGAAFSIQGLSALAGYSLGGFVAPELGVATAFLIPAGLGLVLCVALILDRSVRPVPAPPARLRANLAGPLRSAPVRASIACFLSVGLIGSAVQTLGPLRLEEAGYSISDLGAIFLLGALVSLAATPIAGRIADRKGILRAITFWCVATPVVVVVLTVPPGPSWTTAVALVAIVPLSRIGGTLAYARGADYAPLGAGLAAAFGVLVGAWSVGAAIGPLAAGAVADAFGDSAAFLVAALAAALVGIPAWRRSKAESG
jgi:predicted MFS family arabinose efflux permease